MPLRLEPASGISYGLYHEREFNRAAVRINPGGYAIATTDMTLVTVLGSCIAVCMHDPVVQVGGMNHFMLPGDGAGTYRGTGLSSLYGVNAMELLINGLLKLGARKDRLSAKLFGGGNVISTMRDTRIGERNARFVQDYLRDEGIRVRSQDLLGDHPRKVCYFPHTGRALSKALLSKDVAVEVDASEHVYGGNLAGGLESAGSVELF